MPRGTAVIAAVFALVGLSATGAGAGCSGNASVRFGDTTASVAQRCGVNIEALKQANPGLLGEDDLRTGTFVTVPRPALPSPRVGDGAGSFRPSGATVTNSPAVPIKPPESFGAGRNKMR